MRMLPALLLSGCWVLTEGDLARHDRSLRDREPAPPDPPGTDVDPPTADTGDTGAPAVAVPCGAVTFTAVAEVVTTGSLPRSLAVGDLDGDGHADLVTADFLGGTVTYAFGEGDGTFGASAQVMLPYGIGGFPLPMQVVVGEFDGNGRPDDVAVIDHANEGVLVLHADGRVLALATTLEGSQGGSAIASAPIDANETPDLAVVTWDGLLDRHLLDETGGFAGLDPIAVGGNLAALAAADLDADTRTDLAMADNEAARIRLWSGAGDGTFADDGGIDTLGHVTGLVAADVDRNGMPDLLVTDDGEQLAVWLQSRPGTWDPPRFSETRDTPVDLATGDFLGDGCVSAVVASFGDRSVGFLRGLGDGTFDEPVPYDAAGEPEAVVVAQLDAPGTPLDVAVVSADESTGAIRIFLGSTP